MTPLTTEHRLLLEAAERVDLDKIDPADARALTAAIDHSRMLPTAARAAPVAEGGPAETAEGPYVVKGYDNEALVVRRRMVNGGGYIDVGVGASCPFPVAYERASELNRAYALGAEHAEAAAAGHARQLEAELAAAREFIEIACGNTLEPTRRTDDTLEWSRSCEDWQQPADVPRRIHVSISDDSTMIDVVECEVTSHADTAQRLRPGQDTHALVLKREEATWLLRAVSTALFSRPPEWDEPETEQARAASERTLKAIRAAYDKDKP